MMKILWLQFQIWIKSKCDMDTKHMNELIASHKIDRIHFYLLLLIWQRAKEIKTKHPHSCIILLCIILIRAHYCDILPSGFFNQICNNSTTNIPFYVYFTKKINTCVCWQPTFINFNLKRFALHVVCSFAYFQIKRWRMLNVCRIYLVYTKHIKQRDYMMRLSLHVAITLPEK